MIDLWLVHQFIEDDCSAAAFTRTVHVCHSEKEADDFIAGAPKARSILDGFAYTKQHYVSA